MITSSQQSILDFIATAAVDDENDRTKHQTLAQQPHYLRDHGNVEHFCAYFAGIDPRRKKVLMGHHKKANTWLFNGGHVDEGEIVPQTVFREIREELGHELSQQQLLPWTRISITQIENQNFHHICKTHYDLWYFIQLDSQTYVPDETKWQEEFYQLEWLPIKAARSKTTHDVPIKTLDWLETKW